MEILLFGERYNWNYSNSFANPVVYALRTPEFREALVLCCLRRPAVPNMLRRKKKSSDVAPATELRADTSPEQKLASQLAFKQENLDSGL